MGLFAFKRLREQEIVGGLELARFFPEMTNEILVCVTEVATRDQIDRFVAALKSVGS